MKRAAFTLVELMVVVAIIVALLALLMPSLGRALATAQIAHCSSNHHQIAAAWSAYNSDNFGILVGAHTSTGLDHAWVDSPTTQIAEVSDNLKNGKLWQYLKTLDIYRCPSDPRPTILRSYSISMYIGGIWTATTLITPAVKLAQIDSPGKRLLTIDEADPRGHNIGGWATYPNNCANQDKFLDWPAPWHMGGGNVMSFADGHTVYYPFKDPTTALISAFHTPAPNNPDREYYQSIYAPYP